jgi:hypothetical protein
MRSDVDSLIIEYVNALQDANEGAGGTWPTTRDQVGTPCTPQMAQLYDAEHMLLSLSGRPDPPEPVANFIAASGDRGCEACWVSSRRMMNHPECQAKIDSYFSARDALQVYGNALAKRLSQER